ncbi:MAG: flagellar biosynthetic protein FliO [Desulfobacteraceae bacterium]|jgi:flagellar protein FliO/FliZ
MDGLSPPAAAAAPPELWFSLLKSAATLCIVLALLVGVLFLMRRLFAQRGALGGADIIKTVAVQYVAPKERVILLDVLGEKLLIGATPQAITLLSRLPAGCQVPSPPAPGSAGLFKDLLKRTLQREQRPGS